MGHSGMHGTIDQCGTLIRRMGHKHGSFQAFTMHFEIKTSIQMITTTS